MKKLLLIVSLLLLCRFSFGQTISTSDSLQVNNALKEVFRNFENPDYTSFQKIAAAEIWCLICDSGRPTKPESQRLSSKEFYKTYLRSIASSAVWQRAGNSKNIRLYNENNSPTNITVFITIWKPDEFAAGQEGAELGIQFKKEHGQFKFSGLETVP